MKSGAEAAIGLGAKFPDDYRLPGAYPRKGK